MINIKYKISITIMLVVTLSSFGIFTTTIAGSKKHPIVKVGKEIKITTQGNKARLCPKTNCNENNKIILLPTNIKLKVLATSKQKLPMWDVIWYKVTYEGKQGWVSEFKTDKSPKSPRYR